MPYDFTVVAILDRLAHFAFISCVLFFLPGNWYLFCDTHSQMKHWWVCEYLEHRSQCLTCYYLHVLCLEVWPTVKCKKYTTFICIFKEKWNSKYAKKVGGSTITLRKIAADIHIDKSVWFWFLSLTSPSSFAPPYDYHSLPPPLPHQTHSPNLQ